MEAELCEDAPPWVTGDSEAPLGEKDMGGWTMGVFTEEQQARLCVDEMGEPVMHERFISIQSTATVVSSVAEPLEAHLETWKDLTVVGLSLLVKPHSILVVGGTGVVDTFLLTHDKSKFKTVLPSLPSAPSELYGCIIVLTSREVSPHLFSLLFANLDPFGVLLIQTLREDPNPEWVVPDTHQFRRFTEFLEIEDQP